MEIIVPILVIGLLFFWSALNIIPEYERGLVFRLGRAVGIRGPGLVLILPIVDQIMRIDIRTLTLDVPAQEIITSDNVPVKVNAVIFYRVVDAQMSIVKVQNFRMATSNISQTTLRSTLGKNSLDDLLSQRDKINQELQRIIDEHTEPWGIKVATVEIKDVELPQTMQRAMAKQAEAERERRAKVIAAQGEFEASEKLGQAADVLSRNASALQLRYLQTLVEISHENNSTTLFPVPLELFRPFLQADPKA